MGRLLLISRLVIGDLRRRWIQSAMLLIVIATTATTLTLGLTLHHIAQSPFARTKAATRGPDVVAELQPNHGAHGTARSAFAPLLRAPGVASTAGPFPLAFVRLTAPGIDIPVNAEGRASAPTAVNRPLLTAGQRARAGGAVLEQGLAGALDLKVGDRIRLRGESFHVVGIALETEQPFYPARSPGLIWLTPTDTERLATRSDPIGYVLDLKLTHPSATAAFVNSPAVNAYTSRTANEASILEPWQKIQQRDYKIITLDQTALLIGSWLLAMLAIASIAVVVGGRMAEQTRRVGLLKAIGATPRLVAVVLLAENLLLALLAAAVGLPASRLLIPSFSNPGSGLLGTPPSPSLSAVSIIEVTLAAVAVAAASTIIPAVRGARTSTITALNDPALPPQRRPRLIALSERLPVPLLLALRLISRRVPRTILTVISLAIAVTMVAAAITVQHQVDIKQQNDNLSGLFTSSAVGGRISHLVWLLGIVLVTLGAINAIFTTWSTVIDAQRPTAIARALGASSRQLSAGLTAAQLLPGLLAACVGIPAGLGVYHLAAGRVPKTSPPIPLLLAVLPGTLLAVAILTYIPARAGARRSIAGILQSE